ncbi:hypothetical protein M0R45_036284 [Rubus argutus]|uniref:CCHC-type domain-containing protein n=1 Tax=Rubus argutus TaxID=59490 RepID=A0AAW1VZ81_RUBAR
MGEEDIQDPQASLERARLESSLAYGISLGENLGYHSSKVVHSSTLELHLWQNTTRTGGATTSTTGPPHDEEVAKLFQAFMKIASFELEGTAGVNRRLKFLKVFISLYPPKESKSHLREIVVEGGERQRKPYSCYNCGEPGHIQPHCPYILPPSYL